jgi:cobalt transporter subunit CbtA
MAALRRIFAAALIAGIVAGLITAALQSVTTTPLIRAAEEFETGHEHEETSAAARAALTVLTTVLTGAGFGLLLVGAIALSGREPDAREGTLWGMAGFAAFGLAPALGLPPSLPGTAEADLAARQVWWLAAASGCAVGLALLVFGRNVWLAAAGIVLIAVPHVAGAPAPEGESPVPADLAARFVAASLITGAVFWAVLGYLSGTLYARFRPR